MLCVRSTCSTLLVVEGGVSSPGSRCLLTFSLRKRNVFYAKGYTELITEVQRERRRDGWWVQFKKKSIWQMQIAGQFMLSSSCWDVNWKGDRERKGTYLHVHKILRLLRNPLLSIPSEMRVWVVCKIFSNEPSLFETLRSAVWQALNSSRHHM